MELRKNCPRIETPAYRDNNEESQLSWRLDEFNKWLDDDTFEPKFGICNRVVSILWRAYSWNIESLKKDTVAVAEYLLEHLPVTAENYKTLKDLLHSYQVEEQEKAEVSE